MDSQALDIGKRVRDLTVRSGAEAMRSLQRYHELLQQLAGGALDEDDRREAFARFFRNETERYVQQLTALGLGYYDALLELARLYHPPFFEPALANPVPPAPSASAAEHTATLELRGTLGEEASATFPVENPDPDKEEVSFVVSEFAGPPGSTPFRPPLRLQPPRFVLEPGETRLVAVHLPLLDGLFVPGQRYTASILIQHRHPSRLRLSVLARASPPALTFLPVSPLGSVG